MAEAGKPGGMSKKLEGEKGLNKKQAQSNGKFLGMHNMDFFQPTP